MIITWRVRLLSLADTCADLHAPRRAACQDGRMDPRIAVLRLTQVMRSRLLGESLRVVDQPVFACPEPSARDWQLRRRYLVVFVDSAANGPPDQIIGLGIVIPGRRATSYERRVEVEDFAALSTPAPVNGVESRLKNYAVVVRANGPLTPAQGRRLVDALAQEFPALAPRLMELQARVAVPVPTGDAAGSSLGQRDASNVLLTAFGMDRAPIRDWPASTSSQAFYHDIPGDAVPHEDDLIRNDFMQLPGWPEGQAIDWTARRHSRGGRELRIYYGNSRSLERQTGVDLVYYNGFHGCFVLVQYKKFNSRGCDLVYWPDSDQNFASELSRMREIDKVCSIKNRPADIQLMQSATFFKFCDPVPFEPGTQDLVPGMYLSREHVETLLADGQRPEGRGRKIDYGITPRYLNNTLFAGLLGDGWIGTRGAATELVAHQIGISLGLGRAVVAGVSPNQQLGNSQRQHSNR